MKAAIAGTIAVVALASTAASVAGPTAKPTAKPLAPTSNTAALDRRLNRLNARLSKLETRVKKVEQTNRLLVRVAVYTLAGIACDAAITADTFQRTFGVIDEIAQTTMGRVYFGPQAPLNDQKACTDLELQRNQAFPLGSHQDLINLFYGP
ncbi:MAG TPA: hypothetical protein VFT86_10055 [Gaiellaceae bacterium]|nr:hypothetical protein [Gaiellaceae bacterium]